MQKKDISRETNIFLSSNCPPPPGPSAIVGIQVVVFQFNSICNLDTFVNALIRFF